MIDLEAAWHEYAALLAGELEADGIPVTVDPQQLNPPCVLVVPVAARWPTLDGYDRTARMDLAVTMLAPPPGDADAVGWLFRHAATVAAAAGVRELTPTTYGTGQIPGLTTTVTVTVTPDP